MVEGLTFRNYNTLPLLSILTLVVIEPQMNVVLPYHLISSGEANVPNLACVVVLYHHALAIL